MKLQLFDKKKKGRKKEQLQPKEHRPHSETQEWEYYAVDVEKEEYVKILKKISSCKQQNSVWSVLCLPTQ